MAEHDLLFLRNRPAHFNLGDFLCTPLHYLDFGVREHQTRLRLRGREFGVVLGGGAYNDLGVGQPVDVSRTVAWGVGSSHHGATTAPTRADDLPFLLYGVRDPDAVSDDEHFLPCVSCLHPLVQRPPGRETGVFLNFDRGITDLALARRHPVFQGGVGLYTNNLHEQAFVDAFARCGKVITNSFHVAYWSLLSGRPVAVIGYSSKFRSLLRLAVLDPQRLRYYAVSDQASLLDAVAQRLQDDDYLSVADHDALRRDCIGRNLRFAQRCVDIGFVGGYALKTHTPAVMRARRLRYQPIQWMQRLARAR